MMGSQSATGSERAAETVLDRAVSRHLQLLKQAEASQAHRVPRPASRGKATRVRTRQD